MLKKFLLRTTLVSLGILLPIAILELQLRIEYIFRKDLSLFTNPSYIWDDTLGWTGKIHMLGPESERPILVIGDSFTDGLTVESSSLWFASLQNLYPEKKIIAYGGLGYGTLQELIVLRRYLKEGLDPSLIIIQLCSNDLINNSYELEKESYLQRVGAPRPYLEDGEIHVKLPHAKGQILLPLMSYSHLFYKYNRKWHLKLAAWAAEKKIHTVETDIEEKGLKLPAFRFAGDTTEKLLRRIRKKARDTKVILLLVDDIEPYTSTFQQIAQKLKLPLIIPTKTTPIDGSGRLADGAHYNEKGNKILGDTFVKIAQERGILTSL